ncbi:MAG: hypothetical protein JST54_09665 [Deltaproteobacteria bacterium]|nr:hypothetical protein [Deltaproteobacteria bacterium]
MSRSRVLRRRIRHAPHGHHPVDDFPMLCVGLLFGPVGGVLAWIQQSFVRQAQ